LSGAVFAGRSSPIVLGRSLITYRLVFLSRSVALPPPLFLRRSSFAALPPHSSLRPSTHLQRLAGTQARHLNPQHIPVRAIQQFRHERVHRRDLPLLLTRFSGYADYYLAVVTQTRLEVRVNVQRAAHETQVEAPERAEVLERVVLSNCVNGGERGGEGEGRRGGAKGQSETLHEAFGGRALGRALGHTLDNALGSYVRSCSHGYTILNWTNLDVVVDDLQVRANLKEFED